LYIYPNPKEELDEELERQRKEVGVGMSLQFHGSSVTASALPSTSNSTSQPIISSRRQWFVGVN